MRKKYGSVNGPDIFERLLMMTVYTEQLKIIVLLQFLFPSRLYAGAYLCILSVPR